MERVTVERVRMERVTVERVRMERGELSGRRRLLVVRVDAEVLQRLQQQRAAGAALVERLGCLRLPQRQVVEESECRQPTTQRVTYTK